MATLSATSESLSGAMLWYISTRMVSITMSSSGTASPSCGRVGVWLFPAVLKVGLELGTPVTQKVHGMTALEAAKGAQRVHW